MVIDFPVIGFGIRHSFSNLIITIDNIFPFENDNIDLDLSRLIFTLEPRIK